MEMRVADEAVSSERSLDGALTVATYFGAFAPVPAWEELPRWPPDVFALTNLILDQTGSYRFVVAPPPGARGWPPTPDWTERVPEAAKRWRTACGERGGEFPELVKSCWELLTRSRSVPLSQVRSGEAWEVCETLLTLHAVADEACAGLATDRPAGAGSFEARALALLQQRGTLSHLSSSRVRVVPKTQFATRGITIRSLSRYLALCYEAIDVQWRRVDPDNPTAALAARQRDYTILLIPWPLTVSASDFHPVPTPLGNMPAEFGFFEFAPEPSLDVAYVDSLCKAVCGDAGKVDAVIMPEAALEPEEVAVLEDALELHGTAFLIVGVRERRTSAAFGRNYLHFGIHTSQGWERLQQDKHHRWCLDANQIHQYHLGRALDPKKLWWEAIDIRSRSLHVIDIGRGATTAPLVCEDLARLDEVADTVRRVGPSLVIALLFDGPQLATRWPSRYASVLSDEPGCAVLTLTSYGMAARSRPPGMHQSRVVALWRSARGGQHEIELGRGADAIAITMSVGRKTVWTADGRPHRDVPDLLLSDIRQIRVPGRRPTRAALAGSGRAGDGLHCRV